MERPTTPNAPCDRWKETIENVLPNVVSIHFSHPRSFDSERAHTGEATGFVVDDEKGYILTNRHVVGAGPFCGYVVFANNEQVDTYAVYRDPIHDFGILRFDPKAIKHIKFKALHLRPDLAEVGVEIRVLGNDAGEKISILSSFISRLDRNAPEYDEGYNDFNTCYYQANAAASGGSSGSPVINIDGFAIALQAGGRCDGASTDYLLPLDRPLRALKCIQQDKPVTRGDIQCQFLLTPFDECERLGLTSKWQTAARKAFPKENNMLVAEIVLPKGQSHQKIAEGDILIKVNGELMTQFICLDDLLDSNVGETIHLLLQRGGEDIEVEVKVGDLHKITPDRFVSVAGASFHDLSYQQARLYAVACEGVFVCEAAGSFAFAGPNDDCLIQSLNNVQTPDLKTFIKVMAAIADCSRVVVAFKSLRNPHNHNSTVAYIDRHWAPEMQIAIRNDVTGLWDFSNLAEPLPPAPPVSQDAVFIQLENLKHPGLACLVASFVSVHCTIPFKLDGFPYKRTEGMGLVVDAQKGFIIVSRAIVPQSLCILSITIADSIIVKGKVVFLHPLQNYAIVQYDSKLVDANVREAKLSSKRISPGTFTNFMGYNLKKQIVHTSTTVTEVAARTIRPSQDAPRYRAVNVDTISVDTQLSRTCDGVLAESNGTVIALWLSFLGPYSAAMKRNTEFNLGLDTSTLYPVISQVREGIDPKLRVLLGEFAYITMCEARSRGVIGERIREVTKTNKTHHRLLIVTQRTLHNVSQSNSLQEDDILLKINSKMVNDLSDLDVMYSQEVLDVLLVRNRRELEIKVNTIVADNFETKRFVSFCGATFQQPHHAVRQQISKWHSEIYVSGTVPGSPSDQYDLGSANFIMQVNEEPTTNLESFIAVVQQIPDDTYFRLKGVNLQGIPWVITMKKNEHYFPTSEWVKGPTDQCGWRKITYKGGNAAEKQGPGS